MHNVCSANKSSIQCPLPGPPQPPALPSPLPCTLYLQDEAALGHSCPAGDNAGVEPGIRELCLGDPNPNGDEGETSALGEPLVTHSHFVQSWVPAPKPVSDHCSRVTSHRRMCPAESRVTRGDRRRGSPSFSQLTCSGGDPRAQHSSVTRADRTLRTTSEPWAPLSMVGGTGRGDRGAAGAVGAGGGPGTAPQVPALLTQHVQRVQPRVLAQAVPGQAGVSSGVGGSQPLQEQGAAIRGHPAWPGWDSDLRAHPQRALCSVYGQGWGYWGTLQGRDINWDPARVTVTIPNSKV